MGNSNEKLNSCRPSVRVSRPSDISEEKQNWMNFIFQTCRGMFIGGGGGGNQNSM